MRYIALFLSLLSSLAYAETSRRPIVIDGALENVPIYKNVLWNLQKPETSIDTALKDLEEGKFHEASNDIPNFGHYNGDVWVYFEIVDKSSVDRELILSLERPTLNFAKLYSFERNQSSWQSSAPVGLDFPTSLRTIKSPDLAFSVKPRAGITNKYLLQLRGIDGISIPLYLRTLSSHLTITAETAVLFGTLYGLILLTLMYSLILFLVVRDSVLLYYAGFVAITHGLIVSQVFGLNSVYLWGNFPWWNQRA